MRSWKRAQSSASGRSLWTACTGLCLISSTHASWSTAGAADRRDQSGAAGGLVVGPIRFVLLRQDLEALHRDAADDPPVAPTMIGRTPLASRLEPAVRTPRTAHSAATRRPTTSVCVHERPPEGAPCPSRRVPSSWTPSWYRTAGRRRPRRQDRVVVLGVLLLRYRRKHRDHERGILGEQDAAAAAAFSAAACDEAGGSSAGRRGATGPRRRPVLEPTSELGTLRWRVDGVESPRHRADAVARRRVDGGRLIVPTRCAPSR